MRYYNTASSIKIPPGFSSHLFRALCEALIPIVARGWCGGIGFLYERRVGLIRRAGPAHRGGTGQCARRLRDHWRRRLCGLIPYIRARE